VLRDCLVVEQVVEESPPSGVRFHPRAHRVGNGKARRRPASSGTSCSTCAAKPCSVVIAASSICSSAVARAFRWSPRR
jgi:hypothetical protein